MISFFRWFNSIYCVQITSWQVACKFWFLRFFEKCSYMLALQNLQRKTAKVNSVTQSWLSARNIVELRQPWWSPFSEGSSSLLKGDLGNCWNDTLHLHLKINKLNYISSKYFRFLLGFVYCFRVFFSCLGSTKILINEEGDFISKASISITYRQYRCCLSWV